MVFAARRRAASLRREQEEALLEPKPSKVLAIRQARRFNAAVASISLSPGTPKIDMQPLLELAKDDGKDLKKKAKAVAASAQEAVTPPPPWRVLVGNLGAGAIAGCVVEAALYPLDTIKTRLQLMRSGGGLKALLQAGGGKALYAGIGGNLIGVAPASAIFMACYEPVKRHLAVDHGPQASFLGAGAVAGLAASFVRVPTEVVKQRMQNNEFRRARAAVSTIVSREGMRGLYAGYGAFLLRDLPFDAIEFWAFDTLKYNMTKYFRRDLNPFETGMCGAVAGALTGFTTTPLDVLKTRLMTQGSGTDAVYKNVFDAAARISREEGVKAFFKGWEPRVTWIAIGGCIFFTALEQAKKLLVPESAISDPSSSSSAH